MSARQNHPDGTVYPDGTILWCGRRIWPIPQEVWEEGEGPRFACQFTGSSGTAEGRCLLMGASRLRWGCDPGERSPPNYNPVAAAQR